MSCISTMRKEIQSVKFLVIGHGRHGKDTVGELIAKHLQVSYVSSSEFCSELFIFDTLKDAYGYQNAYECFTDRHNHRAEWYNLINEYNKDNGAKLAIEIFKQHNIYTGLRNKREWAAAKNSGCYDYCIWVDRSDVLPIEDEQSMTLEPWMADYVIDNNRSLENLQVNVLQLLERLKQNHPN